MLILTPGSDPNCIIDATLPTDAENNYLDCTTDEHKEKKTTDCCVVDNRKDCCDKGAR